MANEIKFKYKKYSYLGWTSPTVPNGWKPLVVELIKNIDKLARPWWLPRFIATTVKTLAMGSSIIKIRNKFWYVVFKKLPITCSISQIKEKFGGLRFYCSGTDEIFALVHVAEDASYKICQYCGTTDNVSRIDDGWIRTICTQCKL